MYQYMAGQGGGNEGRAGSQTEISHKSIRMILGSQAKKNK